MTHCWIPTAPENLKTDNYCQHPFLISNPRMNKKFSFSPEGLLAHQTYVVKPSTLFFEIGFKFLWLRRLLQEECLTVLHSNEFGKRNLNFSKSIVRFVNDIM